MNQKIKFVITNVLVGLLLVGGLVGASTITTIQGSDSISDSRAVINTNFSNLNSDKYEAGDNIHVGSATTSDLVVTSTLDVTGDTTLSGLTALDITSLATTSITDLTVSSAFKLGGTVSATDNLTMEDTAWIGTGSSAGRIIFDDETTDYINFSNANVGIGTTTPSLLLTVGATSSDQFMVDTNGNITDGTWTGDVIDISGYTNLSGGNGITRVGDSLVVDELISGSDGDSSSTSSDSGLEIISSKLSIIRGCADAEVLKWNEANDYWECGAAGGSSSGFSSRARAYRSVSVQDLGGSTWTKIQLNSESYDGDGEFDNSTNYRFTADSAGYYLVAATVAIAPTDGGRGGRVAIYKNGSSYALANGVDNSYETVARISISDIVYLDGVDDYIELYGYSQSGAPNNALYGSNETYMSIHQLSE